MDEARLEDRHQIAVEQRMWHQPLDVSKFLILVILEELYYFQIIIHNFFNQSVNL